MKREKIEFTTLERGEILRALEQRKALLKAQKEDPVHGVALKAGELALIQEIEEKLIKW